MSIPLEDRLVGTQRDRKMPMSYWLRNSPGVLPWGLPDKGYRQWGVHQCSLPLGGKHHPLLEEGKKWNQHSRLRLERGMGH